MISTFAGTSGTAGYSGDGGPGTLAALNYPQSVAFDPSGNLYIADTLNAVVRMMGTNGNISTFASTPQQSGFAGDGGLATAAQLNGPQGVALDAAGNLYIADSANEAIRIVDQVERRNSIEAGKPCLQRDFTADSRRLAYRQDKRSYG